MVTPLVMRGVSRATGLPARRSGSHILHELWRREPRLASFAVVLIVLMVPAAILLGIDERALREVNVWVKPLKFLSSVALLALTTAWFIGYLPAERRRSRAMNAIVWTLIGTGSFEIAYITLQAGLGQASHYNETDALHAALYVLMGVGALTLSATQPALAWQLHRHGDRTLAPAYRLSVLLGLVLTFVLGAGVGMLLSNMQPPTGPGLPLFGWSTIAGDLRSAHFIGIHAEQVLPVVGAIIVALRLPAARTWIVLATLAWSGLFAFALMRALAGQPFITP